MNETQLLPGQLATPRLLLRRWRTTDAAALESILAANFGHLGPWIPRKVAEPADREELATRLAGYSRAFDESREWRYALLEIESADLVGEVSLFPRNEGGRVSFDVADAIEIGYWLRADATGLGYATEAAQAAVGLATRFSGIGRLTMYCDERNTKSAAIPRRLGFVLAHTIDLPPGAAVGACSRLQVWEHRLRRPDLSP